MESSQKAAASLAVVQAVVELVGPKEADVAAGFVLGPKHS